MDRRYRLTLVLDVSVDDEVALRDAAFRDATAFEEQIRANAGAAEHSSEMTDSMLTVPGSALIALAFDAIQSLPGVSSVQPLPGSAVEPL